MSQKNSMLNRYARIEDRDDEFTSGSYVPLEARYPRGRMPMLYRSSSNSVREVIEQEDRQLKNEHPKLTSHVGNQLYDPSFVVRGLPMDPYLRMLKENPNFFKIESKLEADRKDKVKIDLNN
ncbi:hypothetical protein P3S68_027557 [Capsicum galapagoense]